MCHSLGSIMMAKFQLFQAGGSYQCARHPAQVLSRFYCPHFRSAGCQNFSSLFTDPLVPLHVSLLQCNGSKPCYAVHLFATYHICFQCKQLHTPLKFMSFFSYLENSQVKSSLSFLCMLVVNSYKNLCWLQFELLLHFFQCSFLFVSYLFTLSICLPFSQSIFFCKASFVRFRGWVLH